ncbi:MAG: hypothetical protein PUE13_05350 [Clostridiales bacterium]|nr:hypothetical protein [Clostridiales bacterium]
MDIYGDIMRAERCRTMNYGADIAEECEVRCPICNSVDWDFLLRDNYGDIIGCEDCVTKVYIDEIM